MSASVNFGVYCGPTPRLSGSHSNWPAAPITSRAASIGSRRSPDRSMRARLSFAQRPMSTSMRASRVCRASMVSSMRCTSRASASGSMPCTSFAMTRTDCSNCRMPSFSEASSEMASGRISAGSFSRSAASAGSFMDVTRTRRPVASQWQMMFAIVCVLPVPGGPCTTTPSCASSSWTTRTCSSLNGFGKNRSVTGPVPLPSERDMLTPRNTGSVTVSGSWPGSRTIAAVAAGSASSSGRRATASVNFSMSCTSRSWLRGRANSTQFSVTEKLAVGSATPRSSGTNPEWCWSPRGSRQARAASSAGRHVSGSNGENVCTADAKNSRAICSARGTPGLRRRLYRSSSRRGSPSRGRISAAPVTGWIVRSTSRVMSGYDARPRSSSHVAMPTPQTSSRSSSAVAPPSSWWSAKSCA